MFPRLPEQSGRGRKVLPLILAAIGLVGIVTGVIRGDAGFVVLGVVCLAGAALSLFSSAAVRHGPREPNDRHD